jgi:hypothetical protein
VAAEAAAVVAAAAWFMALKRLGDGLVLAKFGGGKESARRERPPRVPAVGLSDRPLANSPQSTDKSAKHTGAKNHELAIDRTAHGCL